MRRFLKAALPGVLLALLLLGCNTGGDDGPAEGALRSGHYLILESSDDLYDYGQYLVIRAGSLWEFVEYGLGSPGPRVCQVTRSRGRYSLKDSSLTMVATEGGESLEKCPITQADFDGYTWEAAPPGTAQNFLVRNVTDTTFEGRDLFIGAMGWRTYRRTTDPYGYFD